MNFDLLVRLITEDADSQERAAINILKRAKSFPDGSTVYVNGIIAYLKHLTEPYSNHRGAKNNGHLPDLAKLYIDSGYNTTQLEREYRTYMSVPKLNTKPLSRFNGKFLDFIGEVHSVTAIEGKNTGKNINVGDAIYQDEYVIVYLGDTPEKCVDYGKGERYGLCISRALEGSPNYDPENENRFWNYRPDMSTYFVYFKDTSPSWVPGAGFIIVDAQKDDRFSVNRIVQHRNVRANSDQEMGKSEILSEFPSLQTAFDNGVFKFIPVTLSEIISIPGKNNTWYHVAKTFRYIVSSILPQGKMSTSDRVLFEKYLKDKIKKDAFRVAERVFVYMPTLEKIYNDEEIADLLQHILDSASHFSHTWIEYIPIWDKYGFTKTVLTNLKNLDPEKKYTEELFTDMYEARNCLTLIEFYKKHNIVESDLPEIETRGSYSGGMPTWILLAFGCTDNKEIKNTICRISERYMNHAHNFFSLLRSDRYLIDKKEFCDMLIERDSQSLFEGLYAIVVRTNSPTSTIYGSTLPISLFNYLKEKIEALPRNKSPMEKEVIYVIKELQHHRKTSNQPTAGDNIHI